MIARQSSVDLLENCRRRDCTQYLAAQGWSLHRSGGGWLGFSTLRQRLSLTGAWLLSRMHFRTVVRKPARCGELREASRIVACFATPSINSKFFSRARNWLDVNSLSPRKRWNSIKIISTRNWTENKITAWTAKNDNSVARNTDSVDVLTLLSREILSQVS